MENNNIDFVKSENTATATSDEDERLQHALQQRRDGETLEMTMRRLDMEDRLQRRERDRIQKLEQREKERDEVRDPTEDINKFWRNFNTKKAEFNLEDETAAGKVVQELQSMLAQAQYYLTSYDTRQADRHIKQLEKELQEKRDQALKKNKFSFKRKTPSSTTKKSEDLQDAEKQKQQAQQQQQQHKSIAEKYIHAFSRNIKDLTEGQVYYVTNTPATPLTGSEHYIISNCNGATVSICYVSGAVHIKNITDSKIFVGPVAGSVFVDNCHRCTFALASQQLRIHTSDSCDFYVHVTSNPIIEHCKRLRFAPYNFEYENIEAHFKDAKLNPNQNNWSNVKDFDLPTADALSPNWSVLPEGERITKFTPVVPPS